MSVEEWLYLDHYLGSKSDKFVVPISTFGTIQTCFEYAVLVGSLLEKYHIFYI